LSGDEFIIVCEDLDEETQVDGIAARLVDAVGAPFDLKGVGVELSASIGIAFAGQGNDAEQLLHKADVAMYQVKRKGGANYQTIDIHEQDVTEYSESLQRDLGQAVKRHELRLEYQPIVRASDGRVKSIEALIRWDHPRHGAISPTVLIPLAEQSGDIVQIGQWVLEQACIDRHRWEKRTGDEALIIGVNVSAHQLMAPGFASMVEHVLESTNTQPAHCCLEITESAFIQDAQRALAVLSQLKQLGVLVALDDFGTGFSSLSYLRQFPVDIIKIDQSFIADLPDDAASLAIVAMTIELAHVLGLIVICEGVETAEQDRQVAALTGDYCQGFYFSRPMTADMLDEMVDADKEAWTIAA
jgi:EAL domain-containing protein (putative c-di-GMP-specific phosphodiesterase class I)